jgi:DNA topoisomerase II
MPSDKKSSKSNKVSVEDIYVKKDPIEHVLTLPDTYIGSIEQDTANLWVYNSETKLIEKRDISYVPGFYKTCDELFVNARDQQIRDKKCDTIRINVDRDTNEIEIWNNGNGIPIEIHKVHNIYVPELIFGNLLTSSNYDQKGKTVGGKNGYGAKCANIFSLEFTVETVDVKNRKKYIQKFRKNMSKIGEPKVSNVSKDTEPYTKITYLPDYERFGMDGLSDDVVSLLQKRAYDLAACANKKTRVYLNDKLVKINNFEDFINIHYENKQKIIYEKVSDRWKVGVVFRPDAGNDHVSFVNGVWTYQGGTHVGYISDQIIKKICAHIKLKNKSLNVKPSQVKEHLVFFIDAVIDDPSFSSQTKGELTTKSANFGTTCELTPGFIKKIIDTGLIDIVVKYAEFKQMSSLNQTDGKRVSSVRNIPKLEDAEWAGKRKSAQTRLILTEGDSAKSYAISGLRVIGRERYGVFPLKGKLLNVRNATVTQIKNNSEFCNLKKILGLKQNTTYNDVKKLRYGGVLILTDQDSDGSHIKGLIINMFQYFWPELLTIKGFIQTISTPLIKAYKKTDKKKTNPEIFYTQSEFDKWLETIGENINKWNVKYYKGLGTSNEKEAREVFKEYDKRVISYKWEKKNELDGSDTDESDEESDGNSDESDNESDSGSEEETKSKSKKDSNSSDTKKDSKIYESKSYDSITLAFSENRADDRKSWLSKYNPHNVLEYTQQDVTYSEFVDKDLIHFSNEDNIRSIPSLVDGLKPSQRKILYACKKKNQRSEIKVAQLASYVSEHTAYKHGEKSLEEAIVGMAQRFPGSNNIYLLHPSGNFGYRKLGGKEHASTRYIFTYIEPITYKIFREEDESILNFVEDEGEIVEPEFYHPIIPMILVNGSKGIGTGFSTGVPQYNPKDICKNILRMLDGKEMRKMDPWFHGFNGEITQGEKDYKYVVSGKYEMVKDKKNIVKITEIPIKGNYCWIDKYEELLGSLTSEKQGDGKKIVDVKSKCGNNEIEFNVEFARDKLQNLVKKGKEEIDKFLKINANITVSNLYLYNHKNVMTRYDTPLDIMEEFFEFRLKMYKLRRKTHLKLLNNQLELLKYKVKFINDILKKTIVIENKKKDKIIELLEKLKYPKLSTKMDAEEEEKTYRYVTDMQLFSLTEEKINELKNEYNKKKEEYEDYNSTTPSELWRRELEELMEFYEKWTVEREEEEQDDNLEDDENEKKPKKRAKKPKKKD